MIRVPVSTYAARHSPSAPGGRWSLRTQLIIWNIVALALLLGTLGVFVRYAVNSLLLVSVKRRLETEVRISPPPMLIYRDDFGGDPRGAPPQDGGNLGGAPPNDGHGPLDGPPPPDGRQSPPEEQPPGEPPSRGGFQGGPSSEDVLSAPGPRERPPFGRQAAMAAPPPPLDVTEPYGARHFDLQGRPLGSRGLLDPNGFAAVRNAQSEDYFSRITINGAPWQILTRPYRSEGRLLAIVQAGYPLTDVNEALAGLDSALLMMIPIGLLCAAAGGAYLTSHVLRSVRNTAAAAARISISKRGDFSARLPVIGKDEFAELAATINDLFGRLEAAFHKQIGLLDQQRRFTADASHELKTPLTVIRGMASLTLDENASPADYKRCLDKIDRASAVMANLVQDLLLLARSDSERLDSDRIELLVRDLLEQAVHGVRPEVSTPPISIVCLYEALTVLGNEGELIRVFSNLLENALRHTSAEGAIDLVVTKADNYVRVRVRDTGIGIAPEHLPHLTERFFRVDSSRTRSDGGSGLGLSICKSIVEAHEGTIAFESVLGAGTTVSVFLPLAS